MDNVRHISVSPSLLSLAQSGDRPAMNELLTAITPYVSRLCRSITHDVADATQESLLAVYRGLGTLRDPAAFYGWVRSVTIREAVRTAKRSGTPAPYLSPESGPTTNPLDAVHISDVLERLPRSHRQVLTMRAYGLNEEEMAELLALPVGTVRSRLHRARLRFREAWQPAVA
ncbi:RNA polymerase sigma factor [Actinoplanes teichomyceticus]|uniref:RNA polymerase sigma-70 factor (ECF subfamily) n=1 Tax=Actinoplanes teichomyceticus TaxID=1867 RepID=A0A561VI85_ACTTI|nr:RNA polymerase sigma factor [Actinoplanes teichomyceticus]TWG11321.1 RNA polymerase sigma-70 factor (ECF subfamily) [Actinoplanes teichomyceticus]GIF16352.1 hypothetical protein Ate01nite_63840 [Actinoplanes teichomyceticus]